MGIVLGPDALALLPSAETLADGDAVPSTSKIGTVPMGYDASTGYTAGLHLIRGNEGVSLLAEAARTVQTSSPDQFNRWWRGVLLVIYVAAAGGGGGLTPLILPYEPLYGGAFLFTATPTKITATGTYTYLLYPGVTTATGVTQVFDRPLPRRWKLRVDVDDATSYTYRAGACMIR